MAIAREFTHVSPDANDLQAAVRKLALDTRQVRSHLAAGAAPAGIVVQLVVRSSCSCGTLLGVCQAEGSAEHLAVHAGSS